MIKGKKITGINWGTRGIIYDIMISDMIGQPNNWKMTWNYDGTLQDFLVFIDGKFIQHVKTNELLVNSSILSNIDDDYSYFIDILPCSEFEALNIGQNPTLFEKPKFGNHFKLNWTPLNKNDFPGFYAYSIYWNSGSGTSADLLLKNVVGIEQSEYITPQLTDKILYVFEIKQKDYLGNIVGDSNILSGYIDTTPEMPSGVALYYSSGTRKATFSGYDNSGQESDFAGYKLYSNYNIYTGELNETINYDEPIITTYDSGISLTSFELHSGRWQFDLRAYDVMNLESNSTLKNLYLYDSSGILKSGVYVSIQTPYYIDAYPIISGLVRVETRITNPCQTINFYKDGTLISGVTFSQTLHGSGVSGYSGYGTSGNLSNNYTYTLDILSDSNNHTYQTSTSSGAVESPLTDPVSTRGYLMSGQTLAVTMESIA